MLRSRFFTPVISRWLRLTWIGQRDLCRRGYLRAHRNKEEGSGGYSSQMPEMEHPVSRTIRILGEDFKALRRGRLKTLDPIPIHADIVIIGGGVIGSSIAYWLKQRAPESFTLAVIERDPTYVRASTALSVGGIRQQFSLPENIELSMFSASFLRNIKKHLSVLDQDPPDIQYNPHGYLFLAPDSGAEILKQNYDIQIDLGAKLELLTPDALKERFPWLNTQGIVLGAHGLENEGWFDPWALLMAFKRKAISFGAKYVNAEVVEFEFKEIRDMELEGTDEPYKSTNYLLMKMDTGEIRRLEFAICIVAAGAYSADVAKLLRIGTGPGILQYPLPVEPRKRYVYVFHCENGPGLDFPFVIDPSGVYCRREGLGGNYVGGRSPTTSEEPDNSNLDVDYTFFDNAVWPGLAEKIPCFEAIKLRSAWAGYYDYNSLDQNALVGRHPYYNNIFFATGFSGHGIQMAPAVGRAIMELILDGGYATIDLDRFQVDRIILNNPIYERNIV